MNEYKITLEKCIKNIENTQHFKDLEKKLTNAIINRSYKQY